ncbi:LysR substrate-binding domain-containing protein [Actinomadura alba]|uniref:LysR family transcriptional regulator n=1 Tax=Actinomadura alba TaxID=406431 RepID=A0ABR7LKD6_9ACTN|nr:LysR substrate-binding domain-containing protein [Actinomadura alba]MBC6465210.1 LysR family transcriptional regulator [Actinomadura alba]
MLSVPALRLLHELRLRGTLTAAAEALFLSRSAASHQLATLQRAAGTPLTERVGRTLRLTEAGVELAIRAERVLREIEEAGAAMERLHGTLSGTIRVGLVQTMAIHVLPRVLVELREEHPLLRVEGRSLTTEDALVAVSSGEIDLAVVPSYDTTPLRVSGGLRQEALFRDPVRLAVPAAHPLAGRPGPVRIGDLATERWIAGDRGTYFGQLVPSLCRQAGFTPDIVHRSGDYAVVAALVAADHCVALIPASSDVDRWPNVTTLEPAADGVGRDVVALLRAGSRDRPAVQAVLRVLRRRERAEPR